MQFDATGDYLATGDKGGRIVIFSRLDNDEPGAAGHQYMPYAEFQSHESEFDYLKVSWGGGAHNGSRTSGGVKAAGRGGD